MKLNSKPVVLLVEDHAPNVLVVKTFLENFGYDCDVASTGMEALEKVKANNNYSVALMDVQMPGINGCEATKLIRKYEQESARSHLRIIGMTANAFAEDKANCLSAGMDDYISKPFDPKNLQTKLANHINASN